MRRSSPSLALLGALVLCGCGSTAHTASTSTVAQEPNPVVEKAAREHEKNPSHIEDTEEAKRRSEQAGEQAQAAQLDAFERLLTHRHAVGMKRASVEHALGAPDHEQEIAGQVFLYYKDETSPEEIEYQVVVTSGVVRDVNKYS